MTGEKSHSEIFVSGHLAQKEEKGAPTPRVLIRNPALGAASLRNSEAQVKTQIEKKKR